MHAMLSHTCCAPCVQELFFPLATLPTLTFSSLRFVTYRCWGYMSRGDPAGSFTTRSATATTLINVGGQRVSACLPARPPLSCRAALKRSQYSRHRAAGGLLSAKGGAASLGSTCALPLHACILACTTSAEASSRCWSGCAALPARAYRLCSAGSPPTPTQIIITIASRVSCAALHIACAHAVSRGLVGALLTHAHSPVPHPSPATCPSECTHAGLQERAC